MDYDDDGVLDFISGSYDPGDLYLFRELGKGEYAKRELKEPRYSHEAIDVTVEGQRMHVNDHASPVAAHWDADGKFDLVVGAADGSVGWFRNVGTETAPEFAAPRYLIESVENALMIMFFMQIVAPGAAPRPGTRARIDVVDYDGDGQLDLLVGDHSDVERFRVLSAEEMAEHDSVVADLEAARVHLRRLEEGPEREAASAECTRLNEVRKTFLDPVFPRATSSFVWLYRRKPVSSF